jgi:hypothetical protein
MKPQYTSACPRGTGHSPRPRDRLIYSKEPDRPPRGEGLTAPTRLPGGPMPRDPSVIPILRGRLVLVAERYGTPRA